MRAVAQRVRRAAVAIAGETVGAIDAGLLVFVGVAPDDGSAEVAWLADKLLGLRIFADDAGKMNRSVRDIGGGVLVVSQFTLYGDCRHGRRPSFVGAAEPGLAERLYDEFVRRVAAAGVRTAAGRFAADMQVELVNDGPVTMIVETPPRSA